MAIHSAIGRHRLSIDTGLAVKLRRIGKKNK